jgi:hypothetical protein
MIHMPLKWHHIDKCNKNCRKVDALTPILVYLSSSTPHSKQYHGDSIITRIDPTI